MHAAIFTAALALAGRGLALRVPERYVAVTLLEDSTHQKTVVSGTKKKKKETARTGKTVTGFRETEPPEVPLTTDRLDKQLRAAVPQKNNPHPDDTEAIKYPAAGRGMALTSQTAGVSGTSPGSLQLAIPGSVPDQQIAAHGKNKTAGDSGEIGTIRTAIEKAKSYPPLARKRGAEGTVTAEFTINSAGHPENIRIIQSSGYEILDSAAMNTILRASPFPPVRGNIEVPITFRIDR